MRQDCGTFLDTNGLVLILPVLLYLVENVLRIFGIMLMLGLVALQMGCKPDQPAPPRSPPLAPTAGGDDTAHSTAAPATQSDPVLASLNGQDITLKQLEAPLIEGYGLNVLLNLSQLELAKKEAARAGITVSPEDIQAELDLT